MSAETFFEFRLHELERQLGRKGIAEIAGVDRSSVDRWLVTGREPLVSYAFAVALGTGFDVDDLLRPEPLPAPRRAAQPQRRSLLFKDTGRTEFARAARALALSRGLTWTGLAAELGLQRSTVNSWMTGITEPRVGNAFAISILLGETLHALCVGSEAARA